MLSRLCAIWLVTLIVLPFTAPFATVEAAASQSDSHVRSLADSATAHALPVARVSVRVKVAVSTACMSGGLTLPRTTERIRHAAPSPRLLSAPLSPPLRI
jgi:hypothetical protein